MKPLVLVLTILAASTAAAAAYADHQKAHLPPHYRCALRDPEVFGLKPQNPKSDNDRYYFNLREQWLTGDPMPEPDRRKFVSTLDKNLVIGVQIQGWRDSDGPTASIEIYYRGRLHSMANAGRGGHLNLYSAPPNEQLINRTDLLIGVECDYIK